MRQLYLYTILFFCLFSQTSYSQCTNASAYATATAPASGTISVTGCQYASEYATINGVGAATTYISSTDLAGGFFTVHQGTPGGPVVGFGLSPLNWTSTVAGTYYIHLNTNAGCGTDFSCHTHDLTYVSGGGGGGGGTGCINTTPYLITAAPTGGNTINLTTCQFAGEYSEITGATAATNYQTATDLAGGYITITQGTSAGPVIASGPTPLNWVSTLAGSYFIHLNTSGPPTCGTDASCHSIDVTHIMAGCTNVIAGGSVSAPNGGATVTADPCIFAGEYATITGCAAAATYISSSSNPTDFITVHQGTPAGPIINSGTTPLNWTATAAGNYYVHYNTNSACGTQNVCRQADIEHVPVVCTNTTSYTSVVAPINAITNVGFCMFASDYHTVTGCTAGNTYISTTDLIGGYFTVHQGSFNGPVIGSGTTPFSWTATVAGSYFVHLNTTSSCAQDFNCHVVDIENTCLPAPAVSGSPMTVCAGVLSNLTATSPGNTIRWYNVPTGGTAIGTTASGANFGVNPLVQTTYYAEAWNGSCAGPRQPITISVDAGPNDPTAVTATPAVLCLGASTDLNGTSNGFTIVNDFTSVYACGLPNWTTTHSPITDLGTVNTVGCPNTLSITSSNGGNTGLHSVIYTVTVPAAGNITFDWDYVTTDVDGPGFDYPQYSINGGALIDFPGFNPSGADIQSGSCTIAVPAGATFSFAMTASDDILGAATIDISNFSGPDVGPGTINWFTTPTGGTAIGTSASGVNFNITPGATTTYYAEGWANGCASPNRTPVVVTVGTPSTPPTMTPMPGTYCPNTTLTLTAAGGTAGTGSSMEWYTGANGTGTWMGSGGSLNITPTTSGQTYYVRREGACNTTADDAVTINLKNFVYGLNGATTTTVCTDNAGWHHFYNGNEILLSLQGDITGAAPGFPQITIWDNGSWYQTTQGPGTPGSCAAAGLNPNEERFEMNRSWNVDFGGGTVNPPYNVRFYYDPAEKTAVENAAAAHMAAYPACGYSYKYANPMGFYWFKNTGTNYTAPQWDGTHYAGPGGMAGGTTNYVELTGVTSFSGGSGAVILVPTVLLSVEWLYFDGVTDGKTNFLRWATESEQSSSHFNIQRSSDGTNFTTIGMTPAQGNSTVTMDYTYDDETPFNGDNYYRLELVDLNGKITYSDIIRLHIAADGLGYSFYPNPTNDVVNYQFEAKGKEPLEIQVIDVYGRTLSKQTVQSQIGLNQIPINLSEFPIGSYMVRVNHLINGNVHTSKVIRSK